MNTQNNKRSKNSKQIIREAVLNLTQSESSSPELTVTDICRESGINRTTFYAHYNDIPDLLVNMERQMRQEVVDKWQSNSSSQQSSSFSDFLLRFLCHVERHQGFYRISRWQYSQLSAQDNSDPVWESLARFVGPEFARTDKPAVLYHLAFCQAGILAILRKWVDTGCKESADTIHTLLLSLLKKESPAKAPLINFNKTETNLKCSANKHLLSSDIEGSVRLWIISPHG